MAMDDLSRRTVFRQIAAVASIAPVAAAAMTTDPLPALCARRAEIDAIVDAPGYDVESDLLYREWAALLERIADTVPATHAGVIAQIRFLEWFVSQFEWDGTCDRLVRNMIAGVERLGAAA